MTPDTAALRRDHYDYDYDGHCDDCGERHPCTVLALCDVADEVERLLPCDAGCTEYPEEDCSRHGRPVAEVWQMLTEAVAANTAARTAHAALVADLRALCDRPNADVLGDLWTIHDEVGEDEMGWHDEALAIAAPLIAAFRAILDSHAGAES